MASLSSENGRYQATKFGISTDTPIAADYDNDGKADLSVFRNGIWYRMRSSDGQVNAFQFGSGKTNRSGRFRRRRQNGYGSLSSVEWSVVLVRISDGDFQAKQFGVSTDIPTAADYNGDGRFEQSIFRDGMWYILEK